MEQMKTLTFPNGETFEIVDEGARDLLAGKTKKTRIDFDGSNFTIDETILDYKGLYDTHLTSPDFAFVVYGDRAYLLSYVQDDSGMKEMRFQSVLATTDNSGLSYVKTSGIYVTSTNGTTITSVKVTDINSENKSYKATEFTDANKDSEVWYPSNKAVTQLLSNKVEQSDFDDLAQEVDTLGESIPSDEYINGLIDAKLTPLESLADSILEVM